MRLELQTIEKDGCTIHYWITPEHHGPWLIFMHGAGADHRMFNEQLQALDDRYGVLLWDARGHGQSRPIGADFSIQLLVEDMLVITNKEGIERATFIGQSMGGNTAQEIAFYHPDRVENLILIDCTSNTMKLSFMEKLLIGMTPFLLSIYPWNTMVEQSARASSVKASVREYLRECFHLVGATDFKKIFLATTACLHEEEDYRIQRPFLLVCGVDDQTGNIKKNAPLWAEREPACEFHWIDHAGHCANQDHPEAFNRLLLSFLDHHNPVNAKANME
ncbi:alpha/beta fold hydrolase [Paenibacillus sp. NPDC057967]|uniref:alpha/beta fold hydrolase n=1 Tax=Paenibacillus sp. NPDC057967 TaxID=3346293 RepID=UPI0036D82EAB